MSDSMEEEGRSAEYLNKLYEMTKGRLSREIDLSDLSKELGLDIIKTQEIGISLHAEGLVTISAGEYVRLTNKGLQKLGKEGEAGQERSWWRRLFGK